MSKEKNFEKSIEALEKVVVELSSEDITLEDSIKKYKDGMELVDYCNGAIDQIEKELKVLTKES